MRLNDLFDSRVVAPDGRELGRVRDVRLIQDGPPLGTGLAALRVASLIVGGGRSSRLLGYARDPVGGPWPLHALVRWFDRGERIVHWDEVAEYRNGVVTLKR
jgi:sporulation protein YlmC with PRC-barrel domain